MASNIGRDRAVPNSFRVPKPFTVCMLVWNTFQNDARVLKEAQTLSNAGIDVTVFALHQPGKTSQWEQLQPGLNVRRVHNSLRNWLGDWFQSPRRTVEANASPTNSKWGIVGQLISRGVVHVGLIIGMAQRRPDVIHAHDVNTLPSAWVAARISGARLVYDAHEISTDREGYEKVRRLVGLIEKTLMPRADATITTTAMRAKFFARAYGISRPLVLQNRPRFTSVPKTDRIRRELGLRARWPIVLYQGGLQPGRGLEELVSVFGNIPEAYLVLIGSGRLTQNLQNQITELSLEDRVRIIPAVPLQILPSYTASADIGVQPLRNTCLNHYTTDSNKLFEYIMAGLPVVASDLPEIRHIVKHHDLGILFNPDSPEELAASISKLISDVKLRKAIADRAKHHAGSLSWESQDALLLQMYSELRQTGNIYRSAM